MIAEEGSINHLLLDMDCLNILVDAMMSKVVLVNRAAAEALAFLVKDEKVRGEAARVGRGERVAEAGHALVAILRSNGHVSLPCASLMPFKQLKQKEWPHGSEQGPREPPMV